MTRPRASELARATDGGVIYRGRFYSDDDWQRLERRRAQYRACRARRARGETKGRHARQSGTLTPSVASLYAMGLTPKQIAGRIGTSTTVVSGCLQALKTYWGADSWWDAAHLEWQAATGEAIAA